MTPPRSPFHPPPRCWSSIGIGGDRSCPELLGVVHCRNCPVLSRGAAELFEAPAPADYGDEWAANDARMSDTRGAETSVVLFRIGREWLALDTAFVDEVADTKHVHRVAHRMHTLLEGIVNIRGTLQLCVALGRMLEIVDDLPARTPRLLVIRYAGDVWAFRVQEVHGVHRFSTGSLGSPPSSLPASLATVMAGIFPWNEHHVGYLAVEPLAAAMRRSMT